MITQTTHEEFRPSYKAELLPEGVVQVGYRYKARINTKHGYRIVGEFETPDEAHAAFLEMQCSRWNG